MARIKLTEEQRRQRKREYNAHERETIYKATHSIDRIHSVICPKCAQVHKYKNDVKWKYCDTCKLEVNQMFNTDLYALCM